MPIPYIRLSSFYFFYFAVLGGSMPYWSLYLKYNGFNALEIGQLTAFLIGTKIIAPNILGWLADYTHRSLAIIRLSVLASALFLFSFSFIHGYSQFLITSLAFGFFWNSTLPQLDAVTLTHLHQKKHRYSHVRLWGSIGFIIAVQGIGWLLDYQPIAWLPNITSGLLLILWLLSLSLPQANQTSHVSKAVLLTQILKRPEVILFLIVGLLLQFAHAPYYVFYSIYLKSLDYSATITGLLWALGVVAEVILFIVMSRILARYSLRYVLLWGIVLGMIRWLMIAYLANYWQCLIIAQLLHAYSFGAVHIASVLFIQQYFGVQHASKGQAIYNSLSFGVGGMLGSIFSGNYWELLGATFVYSTGALSSAIALLLAYHWVGREKT
ncbi:MAG: MFS transporter [Methylococcaceae bacterium]